MQNASHFSSALNITRVQTTLFGVTGQKALVCMCECEWAKGAKVRVSKRQRRERTESSVCVSECIRMHVSVQTSNLSITETLNTPTHAHRPATCQGQQYLQSVCGIPLGTLVLSLVQVQLISISNISVLCAWVCAIVPCHQVPWDRLQLPCDCVGEVVQKICCYNIALISEDLYKSFMAFINSPTP